MAPHSNCTRTTITEASPFFFPEGWNDYQLLDSGEGLKRELWGKHILIRPESEALWKKQDPPSWEEWDARYLPDPHNSKKGVWEWKNFPKDSETSPWSVSFGNHHFLLKTAANSPQVGIFPEQGINWTWMEQKIRTNCYQKNIEEKKTPSFSRPFRLLNLFGYTGAASLIAAKAGATVCHVDASRSAVHWASQNAAWQEKVLATHFPLPIRWIVDDAQKFLTREIKRGNRYEAILLDPPTFGRTSSKNIWKIEEELSSLLEKCAELLSEHPSFIMMSTYSSFLTEEKLQLLLRPLLKKLPSPNSNILPLAITPYSSTNQLPSNFSLKLEGRENPYYIPRGLTTRIEMKR